jgi:hypothetical protein
LIHIYIKNGNIDQIARRICSLDSIESVRIRIGNDTMDKFDSQVGLGHLKLIHLNDSRDKFFSRRDRHEHVGLEEIGKEGFNAFLKHKSNLRLLLSKNQSTITARYWIKLLQAVLCQRVFI